MNHNTPMIGYAIETLVHALDKDTVVLDDNGLPLEGQAEYKKDLLRELFDLVGREI